MKSKTKRELKAAKVAAPTPATPETPPAPQLPTYPDRVVPECVTLAKKLLADCEAGRVQSFSVALVNIENKSGSSTAMSPGNPTMVHLLNSAVSNQFWGLNKAVVGG